MSKFAIKIKDDLATALIHLIAEYLGLNYVELDDKLILACLEEIRLSLQKKQLTPRQEYRVELSKPQAIALSIFYNDFVDDFTTKLGNKLLQISNEVQKKYV